MSLRQKLKNKIVDKSKPEWKKLVLDVDGREVEIPGSLNGEILLEVDVGEKGRVKGWYSINPDTLQRILKMRDVPVERPDEVILDGKFVGRNLRSLSPAEFEELSGHKKYLDKWRAEGIDI